MSVYKGEKLAAGGSVTASLCEKASMEPGRCYFSRGR